MNKPDSRKSIFDWFGEKIEPGQARNVHLAVGESYSGMTVNIQIHIRRAQKDGPVINGMTLSRRPQDYTAYRLSSWYCQA